jgi:hypothetical protein
VRCVATASQRGLQRRARRCNVGCSVVCGRPG